MEARLTTGSMRKLRAVIQPGPGPDQHFLFGIRLVIDETVPVNRVEFRDGDGNVVRQVDL